ncbi:transporter substrate-binding domain-containing protein [Aquamicrobium segne]|uniref:Transporter substrate-binding domain-containing protein n=1 Tax=Aquamicrobium segne TaxID=469547 RepID=A0ABW0GTY2_9HYPH
MSLMKAAAIALALLLAGGTASGQQHLQKPALRMAVEGAYAPFNALGPDGRLHGFDIDFGEELCKRLHRDCQWSVVQWDGLIPALQSGKVDIVMSSMTITPERRTQVRFSKPYYFSYGLMIAPKGSDLHFTPQSLGNRAIGVQASTTHEHWLHERFGPEVDIHAYPSSDEMFLDFSNGRLDAIFAESVALFPWMEQNGGQKAFAQIGPDITDPALGTEMGIAVAQDNEALGQAINDAIDEIVNDGTFDKIERTYFKTLNLRP